jgi:hypothetical protein
MIRYALRCRSGHQFEAWFRDSATYDTQAEAGEVLCPSCGSHKVEKAVMAPAIGRGQKERVPVAAAAASAAPDVPETVVSGAPQGEMMRAMLARLREHVEKNCDYVGERFAEEARRIHYGESEERGIYGEASQTEAEALREEGIEVNSIPWIRRADS